MGSGSSQAGPLYTDASRFKPAGSPELFRTNAEEQAFSLSFSGDDSPPTKPQVVLSDTTIINMCFQPELFTNDPSLLNCLKNILIPGLSKSFVPSPSFGMIQGFHMFVKNRSKFYLEHHEKLTLAPVENAEPETREPCTAEMTGIATTDDFIKATRQEFRAAPGYGVMSGRSSEIAATVDKLWDSGREKLEFLYCVYIWGIATRNLPLIARVAVEAIAKLQSNGN